MILLTLDRFLKLCEGMVWGDMGRSDVQQMVTSGHFLPWQKQVKGFTSLGNVIFAWVLRDLNDLRMLCAWK